jgi:hypothetical protein
MEMCHNETRSIAILNRKWHFIFYKNEEQEGKTGPVWEVSITGGGEGGG